MALGTTQIDNHVAQIRTATQPTAASMVDEPHNQPLLLYEALFFRAEWSGLAKFRLSDQPSLRGTSVGSKG